MSRNIRKAATETLEILAHLPEEYTKQISEEFMKKLKTISLKTYKFSIDDSKTLLEQNISKDTLNILVIIYRMFWCDEEKFKKIGKILVENEMKSKKIAFFKRKNENKEIAGENECNIKLPVEYKETIFTKIGFWLSKFSLRKSKM